MQPETTTRPKLLAKPYNWHKCMMEMAFTISKMSKDPSTKVGAVLVSPDKTKLSLGYNGFPSKVPDDEIWWHNREDQDEFTKYELVNHAEINAISQAKKDVSGWSIYVTHKPCLDCARHIVTNGITAVYFCKDTTNHINSDWKSDKVDKLFDICKVSLIKISVE